MLFERFRRPRWQHPNADVRRQEIARLSPQDSEQGRQLRVLAMEDSDPSVRTVATKRLDDMAALRRISQSESSQEVREAASLRYRQLLAGGVGKDGGLEQRLTELKQVTDAAILAHVVRNAREEELRAAALQAITDNGVIEQVALNDERFRIRQSAINRLTELEVLDRIAQQGRSIDKRVARMARERAEELRRQQDESERLIRQAREFCEVARELVDRPRLEGTEHAEAERLRNRWEALGELPPRAPRDRFSVLMNRLESRLATAQQDRGDVERAREELDAALEALDDNDEPDRETLDRLTRALESLPASAETRQARAREWLEAGQRYLEQRESLDRECDLETRRAALEAIAWPESLPEPSTLAAARQAVDGEVTADDDQADEAYTASDSEALEAAESAQEAPSGDGNRDAVLAALSTRLDEIDQALESGHYKSARRALKSARTAAQQVQGDLPRRYDHRLSQARARLAELEDWWRFAVLPKQRDLCERMEALVDDDQLSPPERAQRIRELQNEWRATGGGSSGEARELWERFSQAADRAFEPCREYFEREDERKQANLETRRQVADQLESFLDQSDIASVATEELDRIRQTARTDWKAASPVDRDAVSAVADRFETLMDRLTAIIEARRQAGQEAKQALVDEAEALLEWQDVEAAAERSKELQSQWRAAGQTWGAAERRLRRAFRSACDRLFEAREAERAAAREQRNHAVARAEQVCADLEAVADDEAIDEASLDERLRTSADAFGAIELPDDRVGRAIQHRFERARAAAEKQRQGRRVERRRSGLAQAFDHLADGGSREGLPADAPQGLRDALARIEPASSDAGERCRELCVRLEIQGGLDSPASDQELRLQQQVGRLADGIGTGGADGDGDSWAMLAEWAALGGAADGAQRERVEAAMAAILRDNVA
jgi:hypothetical protein